MTRPAVFLCLGDVFAIGDSPRCTRNRNAIARRRFRYEREQGLAKAAGDEQDDTGSDERHEKDLPCPYSVRAMTA